MLSDRPFQLPIGCLELERDALRLALSSRLLCKSLCFEALSCSRIATFDSRLVSHTATKSRLFRASNLDYFVTTSSIVSNRENVGDDRMKVCMAVRLEFLTASEVTTKARLGMKSFIKASMTFSATIRFAKKSYIKYMSEYPNCLGRRSCFTRRHRCYRYTYEVRSTTRGDAVPRWRLHSCYRVALSRERCGCITSLARFS